MSPDLSIRLTPGAAVTQTQPSRWHLEIPPGSSSQYRLAQLDDTTARSRRAFCWHPPVTLQVRARISNPLVSGTWGFGFWNDPFAARFGIKGSMRQLPAFPNAAWFFFASPPNYLSLQDHLPANGFLASTFQANSVSPLCLTPGIMALPFLILRPFARFARRLGRIFVHQDSASLNILPTVWHEYRLDWQLNGVSYIVDGNPIFTTPISPDGPLGLVLWIDNQYAAFTPQGKISVGTLSSDTPFWLELENLSVT